MDIVQIILFATPFVLTEPAFYSPAHIAVQVPVTTTRIRVEPHTVIPVNPTMTRIKVPEQGGY